MTTGIDKAVIDAGGQTALAKRLGVSRQIVSKWQKRGYPPQARVVEIESEYGIDRRDLLDPRLADLLDPRLADLVDEGWGE